MIFDSLRRHFDVVFDVFLRRLPSPDVLRPDFRFGRISVRFASCLTLFRAPTPRYPVDIVSDELSAALLLSSDAVAPTSSSSVEVKISQEISSRLRCDGFYFVNWDFGI